MHKPSSPKDKFAPRLMRLAFLLVLVAGFMIPSPPAQAQQIVVDFQALAQWAKQAASWLINQQQLAGISAASIGGTSIMTSAIGQSGDNQILAADRNVLKQHYIADTLARTMGPTQTFCPLARASHVAMDVSNARRALAQALMSIMNRVGTPDTLSRAAQFKMLCTANLLPIETGNTLFNNVCTVQPLPGADINAVLRPDSVFRSLEYPWPSSLAVSNDKWTFSSPSQADMPALTAIMHCVVRHPLSGAPVTGSRTANMEDVMNKLNDMVELSMANSPSASCYEAVADRLQISPNSPGQLGQIGVAYVSQCQTLLGLHKMNQADETNCEQNGISYLHLQQIIACGRADDYAQHLASDDMVTTDGMRQEFKEGNRDCKEFDNRVKDDQIRVTEAMATPAPVIGTLPATPGVNR